MAIQVGATNKQESPNWGKAIGVILSFPGFVYSLSCALVIAGAYIMDTWRGHFLIRNFVLKNMKAATVEWLFFCAFLGLPLLVLCISLLARTDRFWEISIFVWFACVVAPRATLTTAKALSCLFEEGSDLSKVQVLKIGYCLLCLCNKPLLFSPLSLQCALSPSSCCSLEARRPRHRSR